MACLNMFNNEQQHQGLYSTMSPRISFSSDFGDPQQAIKLENGYREAPVSSDFAFTVPTYSMISADEVFFKGKMLPLRENCTRITTLKEELLAGEDDDDDIDSARIGKGMSSWKERLGIKRSPFFVPKKCDTKSSEISSQESVCAASFKGNS
ncbi:uncharacterized protein LOC127262466 [Andrographis paniculata]|uniref:uncharacterized protein LOC127262466 n=1 Tax=Andrographis paniculata TaxID=175694 RepID=UPI0021E94A52|nr:uncharacterized protein LOC127262466 [Andrographis paniculata]